MSLRWRLTLFNALTIGAILTLMCLALFLLLSEVLRDGIERTTGSRAASTARILEAGEPLSADYMKQLGFEDVFVVVRDGEGGVLYETATVPKRHRATPLGSARSNPANPQAARWLARWGLQTTSTPSRSIPPKAPLTPKLGS